MYYKKGSKNWTAGEIIFNARLRDGYAGSDPEEAAARLEARSNCTIERIEGDKPGAISTPTKKKKGRPAGSKNKPKPENVEPAETDNPPPDRLDLAPDPSDDPNGTLG